MPEEPFLGTRPRVSPDGEPAQYGDYTWVTYREVQDEATALAKGLRPLALDVADGDIQMSVIGIYAGNSAKWLTMDIACVLSGIVMVPLYQSYGSDAADAAIAAIGMTTMVAEPPRVDTLLALKEEG